MTTPSEKYIDYHLFHYAIQSFTPEVVLVQYNILCILNTLTKVFKLSQRRTAGSLAESQAAKLGATSCAGSSLFLSTRNETVHDGLPLINPGVGGIGGSLRVANCHSINLLAATQC